MPGLCTSNEFISRDEGMHCDCLLYTSDAADERSSVDLGGRRIIKKKKREIEKRRHSTDVKHSKTVVRQKRGEGVLIKKEEK